MLVEDIWRHIMSFVREFKTHLAVRAVNPVLNRLFHEWFWKQEIACIGPSSGMIFMVCDFCQDYIEEDDSFLFSIPWVIFQAPVYKSCHQAACRRAVLRNILNHAKKANFALTATRLPSPFVTIKRRNYTVDALCCTRCVRWMGGKHCAVVYYGDPLSSIQQRFVPLCSLNIHPPRTVQF